MAVSAPKTDLDMAPLEALRAEQDAVDRTLVETIAKRLAIRRLISAFRIGHDLPTIDPTRRDVVLMQAEDFARENDVPPQLANEIFEVLIDWSHRLDREWRTEAKDKKEG